LISSKRTMLILYNLSNDPTAPMSGRQHSLKLANKWVKLIMVWKREKSILCLVVSILQKRLNKWVQLNREKITFGKPKPEGSGSLTKRIASFDKDTQATTVYTSMREAARTMFFPKSSESL